jgi:hypothetical protein
VRYGMIIALDVRYGKVVGERIGNWYRNREKVVEK